MKDKRHISLLAFIFFFSLIAQAGDFVKTKDGIIVHPDAPFGGNAREVQLKVIADNIIRVIAVADRNMTPGNSLIIVGNEITAAKWTVTSAKQSVSLKTSSLTAVVNLQTGAVSFFDAAGKKLLAEKELGRSMQPAVF